MKPPCGNGLGRQPAAIVSTFLGIVCVVTPGCELDLSVSLDSFEWADQTTAFSTRTFTEKTAKPFPSRPVFPSVSEIGEETEGETSVETGGQSSV